MVQFDKTGFTVRIDTVGNPTEDWLELQKELLHILSILDTEQHIMPAPHQTLNLLESLMLDYKQVKFLIDKEIGRELQIKNEE